MWYCWYRYLSGSMWPTVELICWYALIKGTVYLQEFNVWAKGLHTVFNWSFSTRAALHSIKQSMQKSHANDYGGP